VPSGHGAVALGYTSAVTIKFQTTPMAVGQLKGIDMSAPGDLGLQIMIWSAKEVQARPLDEALNALLIEYGYDVISDRSEFRGSWFIKYKSSKKAPELERDFEVFFGSDPQAQPGAQLPENDPEKWKRLKAVLENVKALLIVGTLAVGTVGAAHELTVELHRTFPNTPALSQPAPGTSHKLVQIPLKPSLVQIDAEKNTRLFERGLNDDVRMFLKSRGLATEKRSQRETKHPENRN
jgi:hypothetical protein